MKIEPAMCMKTQTTLTKYPAIYRLLTRKCTHGAPIDKNRSGFSTEMLGLRDKSRALGVVYELGELSKPGGRWHAQVGHAVRCGRGVPPVTGMARMAMLRAPGAGRSPDSGRDARGT
jgi:hypothetical protein